MTEVRTPAKMDPQGRITIHQPAREKLGLDNLDDGEKALVEVTVRYGEESDDE